MASELCDECLGARAGDVVWLFVANEFSPCVAQIIAGGNDALLVFRRLARYHPTVDGAAAAWEWQCDGPQCGGVEWAERTHVAVLWVRDARSGEERGAGLIAAGTITVLWDMRVLTRRCATILVRLRIIVRNIIITINKQSMNICSQFVRSV